MEPMQEVVASIEPANDSTTASGRLNSLATISSSGEETTSTVSDQGQSRVSSTPLSSVPSDFDDSHPDDFHASLHNGPAPTSPSGLEGEACEPVQSSVAVDVQPHVTHAPSTRPIYYAGLAVNPSEYGTMDLTEEMLSCQNSRPSRTRAAPQRFGQLQPGVFLSPAGQEPEQGNANTGTKRGRAPESTILEPSTAPKAKKAKVSTTTGAQTAEGGESQEQIRKRSTTASTLSMVSVKPFRIVKLRLGSKSVEAEEMLPTPASSGVAVPGADAVNSVTEEQSSPKRVSPQKRAPRKIAVKKETATTAKVAKPRASRKSKGNSNVSEAPESSEKLTLRIDSTKKSDEPAAAPTTPFAEDQAAPSSATQKQTVENAITEPLTRLYTVIPVDEHLLALSRRLMVKLPIDLKPFPVGQPIIWADGKQALCETLPYYVAYQGAAYVSGGIFYSVNLDGNGHDRDFLDGDAIIARGGGGMDKDEESGEMITVSDHKENTHSKSFRNNIASEIPVVVLCGDQNTMVPVKMPHRYSVLGWFKPTDIWFEKTKVKKGRSKGHQTFNTMKYRLEKLIPEKRSWWAAEAGQSIVGLGELEPPHTATCDLCGTSHKQVYLEGWMCLSPKCSRHWLLPDGTPAEDVELNVDPRFLKQKSTWIHEAEPFDLRPELPEPSSVLGDNVSYVHSRGMCCPKCGKCTQRVEMRGWVCSNEVCGFEHIIPPHPIPAAKLRDHSRRVGSGPAVPLNTFLPGPVTVTPKQLLNYRALVYKIRGVEGEVWHLIANDVVLKEPRGPDEMFDALQREDIGLKRPRMGTGKRDFINSFAANFGEDYKFSASVQSVAFDQAPWVIKDVRTRLNWAARQALGDKHTEADEFNELLVFQYLEGQKINYHDDGEEGLGPTVTSLSLGAPARMNFRIKGKHWSGCGKSDEGGDRRFTNVKPLEGTVKYAERLAAWNELQTMDFPSAKEKGAYLKQLAKDLGLKQTHSGNAALMSLYLRHGDIMIMHGEEIQQYVEHEVEPEGCFRYALTCRQILKTHYGDKHQRPEYEVAPDDGHYDGSTISKPWDRVHPYAVGDASTSPADPESSSFSFPA